MNLFTRQKLKRTLLLTLVLVITGLRTLWAQISEPVYWNCGAATNIKGDTGVVATLTDNTLTISGSGQMMDYTVSTIPWYNYRDSIHRAVIDSGVTSVGDFAFYNHTMLGSITITYTVMSIGYSAFFKCARLTDINLPFRLASIGGSAFMDCAGLTSIDIPNTVTEIPLNAFSGCTGLTSVAIPNSVTKIGINAFGGCKGLTSIIIPNGVTEIGMSAFSGCSGLTSFIIPDGVTSIGMGAFSGCTGLTSIAIPNGVTIVRSLVFSGCTGLTSATIPGSVTSIDNTPFDGCTSLTSIISLNPSPPKISNLTFMTTNNICLYVPYNSIAAYASATYWKNFSCIKSTDDYVSVAAKDRAVPAVGFDAGAASAVPVNRLTAEFAAGPNPVGRPQGTVRFFRYGDRIENATLSIYNAAGDMVNSVRIEDSRGGNPPLAALTQEKRLVGSWDLRDKRGRVVPEGTYLAKGIAKTSSGKTERVSLTVGVR